MQSKPLVSIVIPTFNSEQFLDACLKSIKSQNYKNHEIIIIDNYSQDRTRKIAEKYGKVILFNGLRTAARNFGANFVKGSYILSIDSDMELSPHVINECVNECKNGFDAVIIPEYSRGEGFWSNCKALEKSLYVGDDTIEAARFLKRAVYEKIGGYDSLLEFGEDWDLHLRIRAAGFKISRIDSFIKHNEGRLSLRKAVIKKRNYGKTLKLYKSRHPRESRVQLTLIRPAFFRNWRKLAMDPVHASGLFFIKACEFFSIYLASRN